MNIRPAHLHRDADAVWRIFHAVIASGDTYVFAPDTPREAALAAWFGPQVHTFVACDRRDSGEGDDDVDSIVGTYMLKANQPGLGSHVANAAFMVAPEAQGRGIGRAMAEHCLAQARRLGFEAMQFNFVVSTNTGAIRLWESLGFEVVGRIPRAFRHAKLDRVDALVMYRSLTDAKD